MRSFQGHVCTGPAGVRVRECVRVRVSVCRRVGAAAGGDPGRPRPQRPGPRPRGYHPPAFSGPRGPGPGSSPAPAPPPPEPGWLSPGKCMQPRATSDSSRQSNLEPEKCRQGKHTHREQGKTQCTRDTVSTHQCYLLAAPIPPHSTTEQVSIKNCPPPPPWVRAEIRH